MQKRGRRLREQREAAESAWGGPQQQKLRDVWTTKPGAIIVSEAVLNMQTTTPLLNE